MYYRYPPQMRYPLERGIYPLWWPSKKLSWCNEMKFSKNLIPPPNRKPTNLKKNLESLCFGSCENTCLLKLRKLGILLFILGVCKINSVLNKHLFGFLLLIMRKELLEECILTCFQIFQKDSCFNFTKTRKIWKWIRIFFSCNSFFIINNNNQNICFLALRLSCKLLECLTSVT